MEGRYELRTSNTLPGKNGKGVLEGGRNSSSKGSDAEPSDTGGDFEEGKGVGG